MSKVRNPNTVTLSSAIKIDGKDVSEVLMREPKAGEMRGLMLTLIAQMETAAMMKLLPRITQPSLSEAQLSDMSLSDFFALASKAANFLVPSVQLKQLQENS